MGSLAGLAWILATQQHRLLEAITGLSHAKPKFLIYAALCEWLSMAAFARMQRRLLRAGGLRLAVASVLAITFAGNALSLSVPMAGPGFGVAFTYREFERRNVSRAPAVFVLVVSGGLSSVSFLAIIAVGAMASGNLIAGALGLVGVFGIVVGFGGLLLAARIPACERILERAMASAVGLAQRVTRKTGADPSSTVASARQQLSSLHLSKSDWAAATGFAVLNWLGDAACLGLSIRAVGLTVPFRKLILIWSAGSAAGSTGITPGGVGFVEVALVAALVASGEPPAGSTTAILLYRFISLWLVLLVGWITFLALRLQTRQPERQGSARRQPDVAHND